jgi:ketosteroid isomerase-like protein
MTDAEHFVKHWVEIWNELNPDRFPELFHPEGTLFHPTMPRPITREEEPGYISGLKEAIPDLKLELTRWGETKDGVLVEWRITGTLADEPLEVVGADHFTLRGDKAVEGVAYFDTYPIWSRIDSSMKRDQTISQLLRPGALASQS